MPTYNPETFAAAAATPFGVAVWDFLNEPESITRMETATALGRPAVEGIEEQLLTRFEDQVDELLADRNKQMIGHMARQIMEARGYVIDMQNVKITNGAPFSRGTRYKLRHDLVFYVFRDSKNARDMALTADKAGARLPQDRRWIFWKSFQGRVRGRVAFGVPEENAARADILKHGYHLYRMERSLRGA